MLYGLKDMSQARGDMKLLVGQEFYLFLIYYFWYGPVVITWKSLR